MKGLFLFVNILSARSLAKERKCGWRYRGGAFNVTHNK